MEEKIKLLRKKLIKELSKLEDGIHIKLDYDPIILENLFFEETRGGCKRFASDFPREVLTKIDFINVDFKDFYASEFDFTGLYNIHLNPQTIYRRDLFNSILSGVTFTDSLDYCKLDGANFAGSKNAKVNPNTLVHSIGHSRYIDIQCVKFKDVTFTVAFNYETSLYEVDFTGSKNARINANKLLYYGLTGCILKDATIIGDIRSRILETDFTGAKSERLGFPTKIRINPQKTNHNFKNTKFNGVVFSGSFDNCIIDNTDFTGSEKAFIDLRKINEDSKYNNCNFSNATVINLDGKALDISIDGRISSTIEEELDRILNLETQSSVVKKEEVESARKKLIEENRIKFKQKLDELLNLLKSSEILGIDPKHLYASVPIEEDKFLTYIDDHYEINRDIDTTLLRFFNLSLIDFTNVNVRGIDFRKSGARINPQTVYNKDISYCSFDNSNIKYYDDFEGCNIKGTNFETDFQIQGAKTHQQKI